MNCLPIPTCYFPTTALFVDDSSDFLLNFVLQLDEGLAYKTFTSPLAALDYIQKKRCELDVLSQSCLREYREAQNCPLTNKTINLDIATIHSEIYNPLRFSEVSIVVVDYAMPEMDGLTFCEHLTNSNIKKILLTGQGDDKLAIEAFNQGLIHQYVKKSDPRAPELITKAIHELQHQYFGGMSQLINRMLSVVSPTCINDPHFIEVFLGLCQQYKIVEYYLADSSGSFLLLDQDANVYFLVVRRQQDLDFFAKKALESGASQELVQHIEKGLVIPCFWSDNSPQMPWTPWGNGLVNAKPLPGHEQYFYAWISGDALFQVQQNKVASYHQYLDQLDAEELLVWR